MTHHRHYLWLFWCFLLLCGQAQAEQKKDFGRYEVHYNAFNSTFLTPEVARQYGVVRSKAIGVINISVLRKPDTPDGLAEPVSAQVEGKVVNDVQQEIALPFRRITEGKAVYFISEFQFSQSELLTFKISAWPSGETAPLQLRFAQELYND